MTGNSRLFCFLFPVLIASVSVATAQPRILDGEMHHLRVTEEREWASFPEEPESEALEVQFEGRHNADTLALGLHQEDVRQDRHVELNGRSLGTLIRDEQPYKTYFALPLDGIREGKNVLRFRPIKIDILLYMKYSLGQ